MNRYNCRSFLFIFVKFIFLTLMFGCSYDFEEIVQKNDFDAARKMINSGDINKKNEDNQTLLMFAASYGNEKIAKLLLNNGADINAVNTRNENALNFALYQTNLTMAELLINNKINITQPSYDETVLMFASSKGFAQIVNLLVEHNADVNFQNSKGVSAMIRAVGEGHCEIVKILLEHKADPNLAVRHKASGLTALDFAIIREYPKIAELLKAHGAKRFKELVK